MKHTIRLAITLFLLGTVLTFSQHKITGKVLDKDTNQPLEYATVVLKNETNGTVTGGITTENGDFSIKVKKGIYEISIEFLGFEPVVFKSQVPQVVSAKTYAGISYFVEILIAMS